MIFNYIVLGIALALSATAAYYAIFGLALIFSAAMIPVIIMGSILETAKVVTASWLYRNWDHAPKILRLYLTIAVIIIMFITSMGIFGYLSRAHIEQKVTQGDNTIAIAEIDRRIEIEQRRIDNAILVMSQLDETVQTLINYDRIRGPDGAIAVRESQSEERDDLDSIIESANERMQTLFDQRTPLLQDQLKFEAEIGPIKYVAELLYGESTDAVIEKSVRIVIIILVLVFDPLAIMLMIAANWSLMGKNKNSLPFLEEYMKTKLSKKSSISDKNIIDSDKK